jgi:hypothetical protein
MNKENVQDIGKVSDAIFGLRPVTFHEENMQRYGLIPEEVELVFPDLIVYNAEGEPQTIRYDVLSVLCLNEIKRQEIVIQKLIRRIERLEN